MICLGWQLGTDAVIQIATNTRNHMTIGLLKYFRQSGRYRAAIELLEKYILFDRING
jgi:hypothetical protein